MEPTVAINYFAIGGCVVAGMVIGFLWFGPVFGRLWARHMGMEDVEQPDGGQMAKSMLLFTLGNLLIAFVLVHSLEVWRPSVWGLDGDQASYVYALNAAGFTWLGFFLPLPRRRRAIQVCEELQMTR